MTLDRIKGFLKHVVPPSTRMIDRRFERAQEDNRALSARVEELFDQVGALRGELAVAQESLDAIRASLYIDELGSASRMPLDGTPDVVVSVASYGRRIKGIAPMLRSLGEQSVKPDRALLWLPAKDFPRGIRDVPADVVCALHDSGIEVRWMEEDLGPHKKYFLTMQTFPDAIVITLDDDIIYPGNLIENLLRAHERWPREVVATRARRIVIEDGDIKPYDTWELADGSLLDVPCYSLVPTGVGGVLYPPRSLDAHVFDKEAILGTCLFGDDLWLKVMAVMAGTRVVVPRNAIFNLNYADGTQDVALYKENIGLGKNDRQLSDILKYIGTFYPIKQLTACMND